MTYIVFKAKIHYCAKDILDLHEIDITDIDKLEGLKYLTKFKNIKFFVIYNLNLI